MHAIEAFICPSPIALKMAESCSPAPPTLQETNPSFGPNTSSSTLPTFSNLWSKKLAQSSSPVERWNLFPISASNFSLPSTRSSGHILMRSRHPTFQLDGFGPQHESQRPSFRIQIRYAREQRSARRTRSNASQSLQHHPRRSCVFVPSYAFLDKVMARWKDPASGGVLQRLGAKKKIFMEPKTTMEVDKVLQDYTAAIVTPQEDKKVGGAMMFAVVGAKLSEESTFQTIWRGGW